MVEFPQYLRAQVYISLDGSADFDGPDDRVTPYVHYERGAEFDEGRDGAQQLSPPKIGTGGFNLRNERGRFSPDNPGSPMYQLLLPGRPVVYTAEHGEARMYDSDVLYDDNVYYDGVAEFDMARHVVDDISQMTEIGGRLVSIETISYEVVLTRAPVTVVLQSNIRVDQCFTLLLDAAGWPADKRDISVSDTTLAYWWCDERNPWDAMLELIASEGPGTFYVTGDGVFHFENRNYRTIQTRSTTSQLTIYDTDQVNGTTFQDLQPQNGFKSVYNRATYTTRRRIAASVATKIYEYGADITLTAGQVMTLFVRPTDPFIDAVSPVLSTDYAVSAGSVTISLTYSSGFLAIITLTAGGSGATITGVTSSGLQLRAKPLTVVSETTVQNQVDASESIAKFSPIPGANIPITLSVQGWPEIDPVQAIAVCDSWVLRQEVPRTQVSFRLTNGDGLTLHEMMTRAISDRITLVHQNTGLEADFWINARQMIIHDAQGKRVDLLVRAERCDALSGAVWNDPASLWDDIATVWGV